MKMMTDDNDDDEDDDDDDDDEPYSPEMWSIFMFSYETV